MDSNTLQVKSNISHIAERYNLLQTKTESKNFGEYPVAGMVVWDEASYVEFIKGPSVCQVQALFKIDNRSDFLHSRCLDFYQS